MDHVAGPPRRQRHVQGIEHQLFGQCRGHRPADNATAIRIEHDREIEKACPCRDVGDVGDPQPIRRCRREVALHQVRRLAATIPDRRGDEPASAHTGKGGLQHQSRDPLAANAKTLGGMLGVNARCTVGAARGFMCDTDLRDQHHVCLGTLRRRPLDPRIEAAGGDTQQLAHRGGRIRRLAIAHEPEPFTGIAFVSRANQAAAPGSSPGQAFERISCSSRSWRFSRRSRLSSSRSALIRPPSPRPALRSDCTTQFQIDCAVGSNSDASSSGARPARTSSTIWRRNSDCVGQSCLRHHGLLEHKRSGVHETGATSGASGPTDWMTVMGAKRFDVAQHPYPLSTPSGVADVSRSTALSPASRGTG